MYSLLTNLVSLFASRVCVMWLFVVVAPSVFGPNALVRLRHRLTGCTEKPLAYGLRFLGG